MPYIQQGLHLSWELILCSLKAKLAKAADGSGLALRSTLMGAVP